MRRRAFLASSSVLLGAGLAGCLDRSGGGAARPAGEPGGSDDSEGSDSAEGPGGTNTSRDSVSLTATVERLQPAVVNLGESGASVVGDGRQYLFVSVDVTDGNPPSRLDFAFRLGGRVYSPGVETAGRLHPATFGAPRYDAERGAGWLVFELPEAWTARHAAVSLHGREWPVGDALRDRLAAEPPTVAVDWSASEATDGGASTHRFEVSNPADRDTRFVAALTALDGPDAESPLEVFNRRVPAGDSVSWETTVPGSSADAPCDGRSVTYRLQWGRGQREQTVDYESDASE